MKITIEKYNSHWTHQFDLEQQKIQLALGDLMPRIDHIGSTSIEGLSAKPIIDILVGLSEQQLLDKTIIPMIDYGYTYFKKYEVDMSYRRLFVKLKSLTGRLIPQIIDVHDDYISGLDFIPLINIHIIAKDTDHWIRHIAFRDFLRNHSEIRDQYATLKINLAQQEFSSHLEYNAGKENFIKEKEKLAMTWFQYRKNNKY